MKAWKIVAASAAMAFAGGIAWANWTPYSPIENALSGVNYVRIFPPAQGTTETYSQIGSLASYTIATLPSCGASTEGMRVFVTNGVTSPTYLASVSSTGAVVVPVFCNGSGWVYN